MLTSKIFLVATQKREEKNQKKEETADTQYGEDIHNYSTEMNELSDERTEVLLLSAFYFCTLYTNCT